MVFCNRNIPYRYFNGANVTILILVDGFLQFGITSISNMKTVSHNPYFSRWFSAITNRFAMLVQSISHNPYFSRWFSAI